MLNSWVCYDKISKNLRCPFDMIWFLLFGGVGERERDRKVGGEEEREWGRESTAHSIYRYQCLPELEKLHPWICMRRVYKATWNTSPRFVLNYRQMFTVLRTGFFSSKLKLVFPFGFNEVLLAEASLTWWERCPTDESVASWFETKFWTLLKNSKKYFKLGKPPTNFHWSSLEDSEKPIHYSENW